MHAHDREARRECYTLFYDESLMHRNAPTSVSFFTAAVLVGCMTGVQSCAGEVTRCGAKD